MKKVLILAYDFPPYVSVGGLRPYNWLKYFRESGIDPVVVTRQWSNKAGNYIDYISAGESDENIVVENEHGTVIRSPYKPNLSNLLLLKYGENRFRLLRKMISAYFEVLQFFFNVGPKAGLYFSARDYLKENKVDAIIATGDPFVLFSYASKLSNDFGVPWIADYRDPWSQDVSVQDRKVFKFWSSILEKRIVKSCLFITTPSSFFAHRLAKSIPEKRIEIVPNGYDPDAIEKTRKVRQNAETLSIGFVGTIYPWYPVESFLSVVSGYVGTDAGVKLHLNFYGINNQPEIEALIRAKFKNLENHVNFHPRMSNEALLDRLAENNLLLLFNYYSNIGTKIYDYMAVKRKILFCYSSDSESEKLKSEFYTVNDTGLSETLQEDLIRETNSGYIVRDAAHLKELLPQLYKEFAEKGEIACETKDEIRFSRKLQTAHLAQLILDSIDHSMKRVMILAYDFPPYVSVGGLRPYSWFKYLHESGVYPVVVTRQWNNAFGNQLDYISASERKATIIEKNENGEIIRTAYKPNLSNRLLLKHGEKKYKLIRKSVTAYYEFAQFLFKIGPKSQIYGSARKYLKTNKVDAIIATGDPFVLFSYAASLSREFNLPWIADYRDPWSQDKDLQQNIFLKAWHSHFEKKFVQTAWRITTVSDFLRLKIGKLLKDKQFHVLANGYDPAFIYTGVEQQSECLQIAFAGMIYDWNPFRSFMQVFSDYIAAHPDAPIELKFYGINNVSELEDMLQNDFKNLSDRVSIAPKLPNPVLLKELSAANVMLLFNHYSYIGTKIFDYVGIKRKIISCYANDEDALELKRKYYNIEEMEGVSQQMQEDLLKKTNAGIVVEDAGHLSRVFDELLREFKETGQIACHSVGVENYSRKIQVAQLAEIIKSLN